jgi:hypothetical protein
MKQLNMSLHFFKKCVLTVQLKVRSLTVWTQQILLYTFNSYSVEIYAACEVKPVVSY